MVGRPFSEWYTWESLIKDPSFEDGFRHFLYEDRYTGQNRSPEIVAISKGKGSLQDKWNSMTSQQQKTARKSIRRFKSNIGKITLTQFAPLTDFLKQ